MFENVKKVILLLAKKAVAEVEPLSNTGKEKKEKAVKFVVEHLPFNNNLKKILGFFLSMVIDDAIETALFYLKNKEN